MSVKQPHKVDSELPHNVIVQRTIIIVRCTISLPRVSLDVYRKSERVELISTDSGFENRAGKEGVVRRKKSCPEALMWTEAAEA